MSTEQLIIAAITVAVAAVILARDDVSEDAIYAFTKDIFDNAASLTESHPHDLFITNPGDNYK